MKILVCAHDANITGGANRSLLMVIDGLISRNVEVEVLLPNKRGEMNTELDKRNIKWFSCVYFGVTSSIRKDGQDWKRIGKVYVGYFLELFQARKMLTVLKNRGYDLVYTNTRGPIIGAKIAQHLGIPHVVHVREFGAEKPLFGFWNYKKMEKLSSKIILISNALYNEYAKHISKDKLVAIPNGIDSPLDLTFPKNRNDGEFRMLLTGRLVPDKGQIEAIKATKILVNQGHKNIRLYFAGSLVPKMRMEWYEKQLKDLVHKLDIEDNVVFLGEIKDMVSVRKNMDIELMCAIKETFGRVTVEGMRSGLLVIGANTGGTLEIISDGDTGILYQQGDEQDLADKILEVFRNPETRMRIAQNGYNFAQNNFTPLKNIESVYDTLRMVVK